MLFDSLNIGASWKAASPRNTIWLIDARHAECNMPLHWAYIRTSSMIFADTKAFVHSDLAKWIHTLGLSCTQIPNSILPDPYMNLLVWNSTRFVWSMECWSMYIRLWEINIHPCSNFMVLESQRCRNMHTTWIHKDTHTRPFRRFVRL